MRTYRVELVAKSGVRIVDPELRELGMTLPGFVERGKVIASLPSLGLLTLAGYCPPHWQPNYREVPDNDPAHFEQIADNEPDLVAISSLTARIFDAYALANKLRSVGIPVAIGGLHATVLPEEALCHADAVVVGDGETAWPEVLMDAERGSLRGIYRGGTHRFAAKDPIPKFDLLDTDRYNRLTLQTTRGCPIDCEFCAASRLLGPTRRKPFALIQREIEAILEVWEKPFIELADDNTFFSKRWGRNLLRLLGKYQFRWFTESDISIAYDPELLDLLGASGCAQVLIGLESSAPASLQTADPRGWKRRQFDKYAQAVADIQSHGVSVNGCFVLGFDHDGPDVFDETLTFIRQLELSDVQLTIFTPFPGTAAYHRLKREVRLLRDVFWDQCTLFDLTFVPKLMSSREFLDGFKHLVANVYGTSETRKRKANFVGATRAVRK
jgi:radical SAM superfamily enzyme YgiQ (UPF0313 family)